MASLTSKISALTRGSGLIVMSASHRSILGIPTGSLAMQQRGTKWQVIPPDFSQVEFPERNKLKFVDKQPIYPPNLRPPKMLKNLKFMRGPELVHNKLLHKQYGVQAIGPGRMKYEHFETTRMVIARKIDADRMFAIWRVDAPWQSCTKKGLGKRMGGGKGSITHYVTPVKKDRMIIEVGGRCEWSEVQRFLNDIAMKLPFAARAVNEEILAKEAIKEKWQTENNLNKWTYEYIIKNNMGGSHMWISPYDRLWFGKYM